MFGNFLAVFQAPLIVPKILIALLFYLEWTKWYYSLLTKGFN